jgi:sugar lactone lactonase YvrE
MRRSLILVLYLAGCHCQPEIADPDSQPSDSTPADSRVDTQPPGDTDPAQSDCTEPASLPVEAERMRGFISAEDFVLDAEGYLVGIDYGGNLIGIDQEGDRKVILPNAGWWTSGMHQLLDGSFVYSNAETGSLMRVRPGGGAEVVVSGMAYPNGIEVDLDNFVYVTEHDAGRVRRIDPETGEFSILADGLHHPNGIQFSTDYQTLFVNSFGAGTVHAIQRQPEAPWGEPVLLGYVPSIDQDAIPTPCTDAEQGDPCVMVYGGVGACEVPEDDGPSCVLARDRGACEGAAEGDPCSTDLLGEELQSVCAAEPQPSEELFCPRTETARVEPCVGQTDYASCRYKGEQGYCVTGWEGVRLCTVDRDYDLMEEACRGLSDGDACYTEYPTGAWVGTCSNYAHWGWELACGPWYGFGEKGGLDGMAVDACDNIYVTEYISGRIYRYAAEGGDPELVHATGATWIPNMHWGNGIGGWEEDVLYVLERDRGDVYAMQVDVHGVAEAYQPGVTDAE